QFILVNVEKGLQVRLRPFEVREFRRNIYNVLEQNPTLQDEETGKNLDLKDLIQDGKLRVETQCLASQQYLGMARPDLFIRLPDKDFASSYFKSIFSIGLLMTMVVVL